MRNEYKFSDGTSIGYVSGGLIPNAVMFCDDFGQRSAEISPAIWVNPDQFCIKINGTIDPTVLDAIKNTAGDLTTQKILTYLYYYNTAELMIE